MKLLIYSHFFAPSVGGVETIVRSLARGLVNLRTDAGTAEFTVTIVTETPSDGSDDRVLPFRIVRKPGTAALFRLVRSCDVLHVAGPALIPMAFGLLLGKPVVVEHHGFQSICPNGQLLIEMIERPCPGYFMEGNHRECLKCNARSGWLQSRRLWLMTFVRRFLCQRASRNITPTEWLAGLLRLPATITVPHGLEGGNLAVSEGNSDPPVIVFQGRLVTTKGVRLLVEAAGLLSQQNYDFRLAIIGDGPERTAIERLASDLGLSARVGFEGILSEIQLQAALISASIVVVPSLGGEVFGLVLAENMQRGLPILASDLGAFREVLGETGWTFCTGNSVDLASKLRQLLADAALRLSLGKAARQRCESLFGHREMVERHATIYRQLR